MTEATPENRNWEVHIVARWTDGGAVAKIFVMRDAVDPGGAAEFSCVSSAIQQVELPADESSDDTSYFLTESVQIRFLNASVAREFIDKITYATAKLVNDLEAASNFGTVTVTIIPDA